MDNPVVVEVTRGDYVESVHRGAIAIVDADGRSLVEIGDIESPIFPRSAIKPIQALYLAESGAVDHFGLSAKDIALSCASHNGEMSHTAGVVAMLDKASLTHQCLECGPQWPHHHEDRINLIKKDETPGAIYNNCSGKHAGFICATHHLGEKISGYVKPDHFAQRELKSILEDVSGYQIKDPKLAAIDGCSIPTYALPLKNLAHAFARFAVANDMGCKRDAAARTIYDACVTHPDLVAGKSRFDTEIMTAFGSSVLVKTGAEGVFAGLIPDLGIGVALKCDDGATRASEAMMAACLAVLVKDHPDNLKTCLARPLKNRNGWDVGSVCAADGLVEQLRQSIT